MVCLYFLTVLESKVLVCVHICKDPNKVGFVAILQHLRDAIESCFLGRRWHIYIKKSQKHLKKITLLHNLNYIIKKLLNSHEFFEIFVFYFT
jgi:NADH dehydrogenase.